MANLPEHQLAILKQKRRFGGTSFMLVVGVCFAIVSRHLSATTVGRQNRGANANISTNADSFDTNARADFVDTNAGFGDVTHIAT
jgi:hypothetical protein